MMEAPEAEASLASLMHQQRMSHRWGEDCTCQQLCRRSCQLCVFKLSVRFKLYCKLCEEEINACRKDAIANNWHTEFQHRSNNVRSFRDMIEDFSHRCPPHGHRKKRHKFDIERPRSRSTEQPLDAAGDVSH